MMHDGDINEYLDWLDEADYIGCDTENSGTIRAAELWSGQFYLTGISTCIRREGLLSSRYFPIRHTSDNVEPAIKERLADILRRSQLGFHNINIDLPALETIGIEITIPPFDTTALAHLCNEEFPSKKLDWLGKFILKKGKAKDDLKKWTDIWGWDDVPVKLMAPYACVDAEIQYELFEVFFQDMQE